MMNAKQAVAAATEYMQDVYEGTLEGLAVEEIEFAGANPGFWQVTMGYWESLPPQHSKNALTQLMPARVRRAYKQLTVGVDGEVVSMKIRVLPKPEAQ